VPAIVKVWDRAIDADGKALKGVEPGWVDMVAVNAKEAVRNDKGRYTFDGPDAPQPKETFHARPKVDVQPTEIPANWESLDWPARKKLAVALGAERNCTADNAALIINAEINRRSKTAAPAEPPPNPLPDEE
jgi:hypothetical protein